MDEKNTNEKLSNNKPFYKKIWFWVLIVLVVAGVVGSTLYSKHLENVNSNKILNEAKQTENTVSTSSSVGQSVSISANNQEVLTGNLTNENNTAKAAALKVGSYVVGKEVSPGYYEGTFEGSGQLTVNNSKGNEILNVNINESKPTELDTLKFQLNEGDVVDFKGFNKINLAPYNHKYVNSLAQGNYTVGENVQAGNYQLNIPEGITSLAIYNSMGLPIFNEMAVQNSGNQEQKINLDLKLGDTIVVTGLGSIKLVNS
ncbi:MAG: hypothetical protein ACRDD2_01890 [Sarcina sp.]